MSDLTIRGLEHTTHCRHGHEAMFAARRPGGYVYIQRRGHMREEVIVQQICKGGGMTGSTIIAPAQGTRDEIEGAFKRDVQSWIRQARAAASEGGMCWLCAQFL